MAEPTTATEAAKKASAPPPAAHDHGHDDHGHGHHDPIHAANPHLAHHFDTPQQQFDAGKLGIWLFLLTEVLFFAGLFCAYTVYRSMHPEVFVYAHYFLDTKLGALNTCVLLGSSLTAAWAVRNAQLAEKKLLIVNIVITIVCAFTFMGVKYVEYAHKFHDGLLPGKHFQPKEQIWELKSFRDKHPEAAEYAEKLHKRAAHAAKAGAPTTGTAAEAPSAGAVAKQQTVYEKPSADELEPLIAAGLVGPRALDPSAPISRPRMAHVFFGIYFFMTGLHGFHVLVGIGIWVWMLLKAMKGQFGPSYFGPIDFTALYWHLVDLIWIYLFPLLYLIH
ncbi:MAG: cytochrome c oxidase subunit 3 family protein [Rhizobacter sp.]|nr:cytochrome c oxidase subunit 3 family protein [Rhizobacter sp.]